MAERYVVLGLAPARSSWLAAVGRWATAAVLPVEFVRCVSPGELGARLASGRRFSTALVDVAVPGVDRDVIAAATAAGCAVVVVGAGAGSAEWRSLGAAAVIVPPFSPDELLEVLAATSSTVGEATLESPRHPPGARSRPGRLLVVTGPGGTGASTTAMSLAQGLAIGAGDGSRRRAAGGQGPSRSVLLADLCRRADQAMLHDSRVLVPGVQEVVESHRSARPEGTRIVEQTFEVTARGYRLLLGLRRPGQWVVIRPQAFDAALDTLQQLFEVVVADVDPDVEGEAETGSPDIEERHHISRVALRRADAVLVVGEPSTKGVFSLVRLMGELLSLVPVDRLVPVLCGAPQSPRRRAELTRALAELLASSSGSVANHLMAPVHLPMQDLDGAVRRGDALPATAPRRLALAVGAVLDRRSPAPAPPVPGPVRLQPGSLSGFTPQDPGR